MISENAKPVVVFDKSFVEATKASVLQEFAKECTVVITSAFYYETFTTLDQTPRSSRKTVFKGFPEFRRVDTQKLYKFERENQAPAESMDALQCIVNPNVVSGERRLTEDEKICISEYENHIVLPEIKFWKEVMEHDVPGFDRSEIHTLSVNDDKPGFKKVCERLLRVDFIREVAQQMHHPLANLMDEKWITFRNLQAMLLHGLTLQYQYPTPHQLRSDLDLEHDVHDIDYLSLGLHATGGGFATNESRSDFRKLGWKFKFLNPESQKDRENTI